MFFLQLQSERIFEECNIFVTLAFVRNRAKARQFAKAFDVHPSSTYTNPVKIRNIQPGIQHRSLGGLHGRLRGEQ